MLDFIDLLLSLVDPNRISRRLRRDLQRAFEIEGMSDMASKVGDLKKVTDLAEFIKSNPSAFAHSNVIRALKTQRAALFFNGVRVYIDPEWTSQRTFHFGTVLVAGGQGTYRARFGATLIGADMDYVAAYENSNVYVNGCVSVAAYNHTRIEARNAEQVYLRGDCTANVSGGDIINKPAIEIHDRAYVQSAGPVTIEAHGKATGRVAGGGEVLFATGRPKFHIEDGLGRFGESSEGAEIVLSGKTHVDMDGLSEYYRRKCRMSADGDSKIVWSKERFNISSGGEVEVGLTQDAKGIYRLEGQVRHSDDTPATTFSNKLDTQQYEPYMLQTMPSGNLYALAEREGMLSPKLDEQLRQQGWKL